MAEVIGIRFKSCGKIYHFEANGFKLRKGDSVVVESEFGLAIGTVVQEPTQADASEKSLKRVLRVAGAEDFRQKDENDAFGRDARNFCYERIMARGLPMKLVCTEMTLDRKRIVFYFTADGRIDFRELVKDLAAKFKTRIEMRQIGVRDKAKLVGGLGLCGKELCCRLFLTSFEPISIKMAKQQDLTLNTGKLSGICGRLMCCLGYEYQEGVKHPRAERAPAPAPEETAAESAPQETPADAESPAPSPRPVRREKPQVQAQAKSQAQAQIQAAEGTEPVTQGEQSEAAKKRRKRRRYRRKPQKNE